LLPVAGIAAAVVIAVAGVFAIQAISNRRANQQRVSSAPPVAPAPLPGLDPRLISPLISDIQKPARPSVSKPERTRQRKHPTQVRDPEPTFVALPFSDPSLATGTNVTIRLALSDAELLALGVRPDENKRGQLYLAEVVLGDDGLPRAITLLPNLAAIQAGS